MPLPGAGPLLDLCIIYNYAREGLRPQAWRTEAKWLLMAYQGLLSNIRGDRLRFRLPNSCSLFSLRSFFFLSYVWSEEIGNFVLPGTRQLLESQVFRLFLFSLFASDNTHSSKASPRSKPLLSGSGNAEQEEKWASWPPGSQAPFLLPAPIT